MPNAPSKNNTGNNHYLSQNTKDSSGQSHAARQSAKLADGTKKGPAPSVISASNESDLNISLVAAPAAKGSGIPVKDLAAKKHSVAGSDLVDAPMNGVNSV